ncbi:hypothetical protein AXX17_ATUG03260 (mitochondrion) [Arabidopsis thaliana]|uniref:Uncharacterized protein n=1 Tax=Arabidopsis thaliana TaxID=3702 RepID=A0A178U7Q0_ARATH|nr:hypothetical protein AXX17_ATUG03260 [Arabidopsis thaliana]
MEKKPGLGLGARGQWMMMPFGRSNAPSTFMQLMTQLKESKADPGKVSAIVEWPVPTSTSKVRSFHSLATFYRRFIRNFSTTAPITECLKDSHFTWTLAAEESFQLNIRFLTSVPIKWEMGNIGKMGLGIRFRSGHEATDYICGRETEVRGNLLYR